MRVKKYFIMLIIITVLFTFMAQGTLPQDKKNASPPALHPALDILAHYQSRDNVENVVIPHVINLMALHLLRSQHAGEPGTIQKVRRYIDWYIAHLNYADKYEITGSMYDYAISPEGKEKSLQSSDSICRYAASFLLLLGRYLQVSGDRLVIEANSKKIQDLAYNIPFLQGEDGLIRAFPKQEDVFLVDNCVSYAGICAIIKLSRQFKWDIEEYYLEIKQRLATAIFTYLYIPGNKSFYWAIQNGVKRAPDWNRFYPDAYVQLFPLVFDVLNQPKGVFSRQRSTKRAIWKRFGKLFRHKLRNIPVEQKLIYQWTEEYIKGKKLWANTKK
jgi:hypothetical protein